MMPLVGIPASRNPIPYYPQYPGTRVAQQISTGLFVPAITGLPARFLLVPRYCTSRDVWYPATRVCISELATHALPNGQEELLAVPQAPPQVLWRPPMQQMRHNGTLSQRCCC